MSADSFQCCFCGLTIVRAAGDPVSLSLEVEDGGVQGLFAHEKCLRAALHPSVPLLTADGDSSPT